MTGGKKKETSKQTDTPKDERYEQTSQARTRVSLSLSLPLFSLSLSSQRAELVKYR